MLNETLERESARLKQAWDKYPADHLDSYLVSGAEDPRINVQSILTRALIANALFPGEFDHLIHEELRFGLCLTWILERLKEGCTRREVLAGIESRDTGVCPEFVLGAQRLLDLEDCEIPDYIAAALCDRVCDCDQWLPSSALDTFSWTWNAVLAGRSHPPISVLEPACGSANDYRFLAAYGLARFLRYTGFDISEKSIANARTRFPQADFRLGNVLDIQIQDNAYDYVFVHDLFEHLSEEAFATALREILRVTRTQAWLSFFNLADIPEHEIRAKEDYHWNTLSLSQTLELTGRFAKEVDVIRIPDVLKDWFGYGEYYNQEAVTLIVTPCSARSPCRE